MKTPNQFAKDLAVQIINLPELKYRLNNAELSNLQFVLTDILSSKLSFWEGEIKNAGKEKQ